MGITARKKREKEIRRKTILEKTKALIIENGLDGFSMQGIASAAELNKATLYLYFKNKEDLLYNILVEAVQDFETHLKAQIQPGMSGIECLEALRKAYSDIYSKSQDIFVVIGIVNYIEPHFPLTRERKDLDAESLYGKMKKGVADIIKQGIDDGTLSPTLDPDMTARLFFLVSTSVIDRAARLPKSKRDSAQVLREVDAVLSLLIWGAAAPDLKKKTAPHREG